MPAEDGSIRGITVPSVPWLERFEPGERVRLVATRGGPLQEHVGREGWVTSFLGAGAVVVDLGDVSIKVPAGELRRLK